MRPNPLRVLSVLLALAVVTPLTSARAAERPPTRVRFEAAPAGTFLVHGTYPAVRSSCAGPPDQPVLHERYRGALEVRRSPDGSLYLIGDLGFEEYVGGIAEVPRDWPIEALKAQVVAARTYALSRLDPGGEYDLCATDLCQVYAGAGVELGPWGDRWARAVEETAAQALLFRGKPAQAYYFSTSNGRTYRNTDVFGGRPLPYLRPVRERDDGASPVSRWRIDLPFDDLARFLAADGRWPGGRIRRVRIDAGTLTVRGARRGRRVALSKADLRDALNDTASCLDPGSYPPTENGGYRLPQTVPSIWYRAESRGRTLTLVGRGWGHGVGMVQWGAYGKAKRGLAYDDILAAYYGGLRPQPVDEPSSIRVLIADGLTSVSVAPSGEARVRAGERSPRAPWQVTGGRRLRVRHGQAPGPLLRADGFTVPRRAEAGGTMRASVELSDDALVRLEVVDHGDLAWASEWRPRDAGLARVRGVLPDVEPGRYLVRAAADDGVDTVRTEALALRIVAAESPRPSTPAPSPSPSVVARPAGDRGSPGAWIGAGAALAALAVLLLLTLARRRGLHRT